MLEPRIERAPPVSPSNPPLLIPAARRLIEPRTRSTAMSEKASVALARKTSSVSIMDALSPNMSNAGCIVRS